MQKLILIFLLTALGCGPALPGQPSGPTALIVVNASSTTADIYIDRDFVGTIGPQSRKAVRGFAPGAVSVELVHDGEILASGVVALEPAGRTIFPVQSDPAANGIPDISTLKIVNHLPQPIEIWLDGERLGSVLSRDQNSWNDLSEGSRTLEIQSLDQRFIERAVIELPGNGIFRTEIRYQETGFNLVNPTNNPIRATIDEVGSWSVPPKSVHSVTQILPGPYELTVQSNEKRSTRVAIAHAGEQTTLELETPGCSARIVNGTPEAAIISHQGHFIRELSPGEGLQLDGLPKDNYKVSARLKNSGILFDQRLSLTPGVTPTWRFQLQRGTLQVQNDTPEPVRIALEGQPTFTVDAGQSQNLSGLPAGELKGYGEGKFSGKLHTLRDTSIDVAQASLWRLTLDAGSLAVKNDEAEPQAISLPEVGQIEIDSGMTVFLDGIAPGTRKLQVVRNNKIEHLEVRVMAGRRASVRLRSPRSSITIQNETGENVTVEGPIEGVVHLKKGEIRTLETIPGSHRFIASGDSSGASHEEVLAMSVGNSTEWKLTPFGGTLRVVNGLSEGLTIAPLGRKPAQLAPGEVMLFAPVPLGRLTVHARSNTSMTDYLYTADINHGARQHWDIRASKATLTILNQTEEPQECLLGGQLVTTLPPGTEKTVHVTPDTEQQVLTRGRASMVEETLSVTLKPGEHAQHAIQIRQTPVRVENSTQNSITIHSDQWSGNTSVSAGASSYGTLPSQPLTLMTEGEDGTFINPSTFPKHHQVNLIEVSKSSPSYWIKNSTRETLMITLNGSSAGELSPGAGAAFPLPKVDSAIRFEAKSKSGVVWLHALQNSGSENSGWNITEHSVTK